MSKQPIEKSTIKFSNWTAKKWARKTKKRRTRRSWLDQAKVLTIYRPTKTRI